LTCFLDSSALVKLYADEPESNDVRDLAHVLVASELARVEVPAALWRKSRQGELSATQVRSLTDRFAADLSPSHADRELVLTRVDAAVLGDAAALVARHPLRAFDAVQLAAARSALRVFGRCDFGCFDRRLNSAAMAEGLTVLWA
jgi:predicted nucleic acid-binding protein